MKDPKDCTHARWCHQDHKRIFGGGTAQCLDCGACGVMVPFWPDKATFATNRACGEMQTIDTNRELGFWETRVCVLPIGHLSEHTYSEFLMGGLGPKKRGEKK